MIEAHALRKQFGTVQAVRDVSFRAADARITGLLGPNGAGKSTTLRMLYTVIAPDGGEALVDGISVVTQPLEARRRMGVLPHSAGIYPHLTARENIEYFGALHGLGARARRERTSELLTLLEMQEFAERPARGFSQGQKLKTALARALIHRPRNMVLDEPTNGLDVMAVRSLRALLTRLRDAGHCVLFSSHVMQEIAALCDDVIVIAHGRAVTTGTPDELRARTGESNLEEAFMRLIGTAEGLG
ncbi:MAG: ATP-binding cassette domain-containing protein [Sinobacteraceae bacterium]|nr:ATP-binding cassette domain-containing protein [Nevskiaceae bacterium]